MPLQRSRGEITAEFSGEGSATFLLRVFQAGGLRLFRPARSVFMRKTTDRETANVKETSPPCADGPPGTKDDSWFNSRDVDYSPAFQETSRILYDGDANLQQAPASPPHEPAVYRPGLGDAALAAKFDSSAHACSILPAGGSENYAHEVSTRASPRLAWAVILASQVEEEARERASFKPLESARAGDHKVDTAATDWASDSASVFKGLKSSASRPPQRNPSSGRDVEAASCEAVLVNTAGGMAGGDNACLCFTAGPRSHVVLTTQSQEKIYRSDGPPASVELNITLHSKAQMEWLPQETILFNEAKLFRRLRAEMAADASLLMLECQIFGRLASGEIHSKGSLRETWRIFRADKLIFAEELHLDGNIAEKLDRKALGNKARAVGLLVFVSPDAEALIENLRAATPSESKGLQCAASAWNGMLLARYAAVSPELLRSAIIGALSALRGRALPRVWNV